MSAQIEGRFVAAGIKGQADCYAYVRGGRVIEIEFKSRAGRQGEDQLTWQAFCARWGIPYLLMKPIKGETPEATIDRWCRELEAEAIRGVHP